MSSQCSLFNSVSQQHFIWQTTHSAAFVLFPVIHTSFSKSWLCENPVFMCFSNLLSSRAGKHYVLHVWGWKSVFYWCEVDWAVVCLVIQRIIILFKLNCIAILNKMFTVWHSRSVSLSAKTCTIIVEDLYHPIDFKNPFIQLINN